MAYIFGDGFDCYAAVSDMIANYWDAGSNVTSTTLVAGRFTGSQAYQLNPAVINLIKSSGQNDGVHHIVMAFRQTSAISGTNNVMVIRFFDGATSQCSIGFRADGTMFLYQGSTATVLATYSGAVTVQNTWYAFEIEVIIHPTAGAFRVRKNGNTSNDFDSGATLNTRQSANSYASQIQIGTSNAGMGGQIDDLLWRSDASSVAWIGDVRCYTRMPASDASVQFSRAGAQPSQTVTGTTSNQGVSNTTMRLTSYTCTYTGTIGAVTMNGSINAGPNAKLGIYADSAGVPGAVLGSAGPVAVNTSTGVASFTVAPTVAVTAGQKIWLACLGDTSTGNWICLSGSTTGGTASATYATFPQANPTMSTGQLQQQGSFTYATTGNYTGVFEAQQDGATTYVYDSNVNDADFYGISALSGTPASTIAVTTRGFMEKSDAGTRNAAVQLKSGATTVTSTSTALATGWGWLWRIDTVDPATSAAWTATGVNNAQIGPVVTV